MRAHKATSHQDQNFNSAAATYIQLIHIGTNNKT